MESTILKCSFDQWYPVFRKDTVRGASIALPDNFVDYLLTGEFVVDTSIFPDLAAEFARAARELGPCVFVKLNFSAPTDAQWIGPQRTLDVRTFEEAMYLLKASTRVMLDLTQPFGVCTCSNLTPVLVLKKSFDYKRGREFRVFLRDTSTYWVSSRYCDVPCEIDECTVTQKVSDLITKYRDYFSSGMFIIDLYISPKIRCHVVDLAPWNDATAPGMFEWADIRGMDSVRVSLAGDTLILPREEPPVPVELLGDATLDEIIASMNSSEDKRYDESDLEGIVFNQS